VLTNRREKKSKSFVSSNNTAEMVKYMKLELADMLMQETHTTFWNTLWKDKELG
jgi:hypothetical protein